ncbi:MAG: hypothetical protein KF778_21585 [Rhodocyclaceae bacterium]|nr:hypothetical protein [Rhodocyclaceae bacterium]MBX3670997.1 hypothetical protein [Rhodocyclaceae bacterium]
MLVPDFWAEARRRHRAKGKQITVRRWGWSCQSQEDAQALADRRADEALATLLGGAKLDGIERKRAYNGAEGVPIREEVVERHGEQVITRNSYGARCLNSPDALFADIDFDAQPSWRARAIAFLVLAGASLLIALAQHSLMVGAGLLFLSLIGTTSLAASVQIISTRLQGGHEGIARRRIRRFIASHADWNLRLYRTPAGMRLLATHRRFSSDDTEVAGFFAAIGADPVFVRMCINQRCFRARLSGKPWRMDISPHIKPRRAVWPIPDERLAARRAWIASYEARARQYAACRYIESLGSGKIDQHLRQVVALHDNACRALDASVPLA